MIAIRTSGTRQRFSRRALLRRMGVSAAMLPLLHAERARAATAGGFPKRLVTIAWTNGVAQPSFYPAGEDPTSTDILAPLAPYKTRVLVPAGLDIKVMLDAGRRYDGHFSYPSLFTGTYKNLGGQSSTATGPSLDQTVSDAIAKQVNLPMPIMNVAVGGSSTSFRGEALRNTGETSTTRMFDRLFAGGSLPADQLAALRARRKSVLDFVSQELGAFGGRLGTEDRTKVGAHLESIRKLELELSATPATRTCMVPNPGTAPDYQSRVKVFNDLAAMAIRCDMTRVVTMVWGADGGSSPGSFPFLGITGDYHGIAHQGSAGYANKIKIDVWYFQQVAYLAKLLDETIEAGGTALDHTVICTANDMNEGAGHNVGAVPFVLVGSCGGYLRTGRAVKLGTWATKTGTYWRGDSGVAHNKLLATLSNAMDVPVQGFGASAHAGTLPDLVR